MVSFDFNWCEQRLWVAKYCGRQGKFCGYHAPQLCPDQCCAACPCWCRYLCAHVSSWDISYTVCAGLVPWLILQKYHPKSRMGLTENVVCCGRTVRTMWGGQAGEDPLHWYDLHTEDEQMHEQIKCFRGWTECFWSTLLCLRLWLFNCSLQLRSFRGNGSVPWHLIPACLSWDAGFSSCHGSLGSSCCCKVLLTHLY